jgi:hypothetical protein
MKRVGWIGELEEGSHGMGPKLWLLRLLMDDCKESGLIERGGGAMS